MRTKDTVKDTLKQMIGLVLGHYKTYHYCTENIDKIADYMMENNVTVLPFQTGQTVYTYFRGILIKGIIGTTITITPIDIVGNLVIDLNDPENAEATKNKRVRMDLRAFGFSFMPVKSASPHFSQKRKQ